VRSVSLPKKIPLFLFDNLCVVNYFHTHEGEIVMSDLQFQANPVYQDDGFALVSQVRV